MSNDVQVQINKLVENFVDQITAVARQAAMQTLNSALGLKDGRLGTRTNLSSLSSPTGKRPKGAKRPQAELEKMRENVTAFIQKNPGLRVEQINKQLGTVTRDLALPLRRLVAEGVLRTEGEKRSTQYFPGEGKAKAEAPPPRRRKKR